MTTNTPKKNLLKLKTGQSLDLSRPLVMGILNVTPDSFSDGSLFTDPIIAVERALEMASEGADIIDIGGESTRPGAEPVTEEEELKRVIPVIEALRKQTKIPISIDTYKANVARLAIDTGADIVNDISALRFDSGMASVIKENNVLVMLMHMLGSPRAMQKNPTYDDCMGEIKQFFQQRIDYCIGEGIAKDKLILDPGIGFGKRLQDNLEILNRLDEFNSLGLPIMIGVSRKSFIGMIEKSDNPANKRLGGSIAAALVAVQNGASIVRVHDVAPTLQALKVMEAIRKE